MKNQGLVWLAGAGMWIAVGAAVAVLPGLAGWARVTFACCMGLTALSFIAVYRSRSGSAGNGLSVRGSDDGGGPAAEPVHRWPALAAVSLLMPAADGRRWLAEAESVLTEVTVARRGAAVRGYLRTAPWLAAMMWARAALRRARLGPRRPG